MSRSKIVASSPSGAIRTPRRSPASEDKLDFKRREMVDWFDPAQLAKTGVKVLLSAILGAYADKREMQAALHPPDEEEQLVFDYSARQEIWLDFIADMGDGFDSTYTMAWLLAQKKLRPEGMDSDTERGQILLLGGDEVYPTAKREEYNDRFTGPYQSALPRIDSSDPPDMFAIPGNHDWYDGLTSFLRLFCQERKIGEWRTHQNKSYFAIKLPHNWWIWGIDIQFEADIDMPQIEYFERVAREHLREGHKIILVNAQPSWTSVEENPTGYGNLDFFVRQTILSHRGRVPVMLTGDLHHYCRYEAEETGRQYITAGGGGAYLFATHRMPETISLTEGDDKLTCKRKGEFPYIKDSRRLRSGALLFPFKSWKFGALLAFLYTFFAWLLQSTTRMDEKSFMDHIGGLSIFSASDIGQTLYYFLNAIKHSPSIVLFLVVLVFGLKAFSDAKSEARKWIVGIVHAAAHVGLNLLLIWGFAYINLNDGIIKNMLEITSAEQLRHALIFSIEMLVVGGLLGGLLMGFYLYISEVIFGRHTNEVFSAQRIPDYKNFLRLRIDEFGTLTIYPIGVTRVCRKWKYRPGVMDGSPWFEPDGTEIESRLIEKPIRINSGN
ncbi:MAG: metallophosphoesterase [Acidobacteriota bacterium]